MKSPSLIEPCPRRAWSHGPEYGSNGDDVGRRDLTRQAAWLVAILVVKTQAIGGTRRDSGTSSTTRTAAGDQ